MQHYKSSWRPGIAAVPTAGVRMYRHFPPAGTPATGPAAGRLALATAMALSGWSLAAGMAPAGEPATGASASAPSTPTTLQTIVVTGTRAFGRTAADSLSPIDVISPSDLAAANAPDLSTALRMLLPSFNFPQTTNDDASQATAPAQLRGLSPDETLVLIDGKRQHTTSIANITGSIGQGTSPVDLAAIPISAIARIEVLRDGAAAQYGSDAIAGVINIILKGGARHGSITASRGVYSGW